MEQLPAQKLQAIEAITEGTIYLMGGSFILGSLFTILLLLALDYMRSMRTEEDEE